MRHIAVLVSVGLLLAFPTRSEAADCSAEPVIELEPGGAGTYLVDEGPMRDKYGKTAEQCAFNMPMDAMDEALGGCAVTGVTLEGSEPAPHLINVSKSFENILREAEVEAEADTDGGDAAWTWSGDVFDCSAADCDHSGFVQVELVRNDLDLSGMADCPWASVRARFTLAAP